MTKEGYASLVASRVASAARGRGGIGGGGTSTTKTGQVLVPVGKTKEGKTVWGKAPVGAKFYPKAAGGYYSSATGKTYATVAEVQKAEAEVKAAEVKVEPKAEYYYQPTTGAITKQRVVGQRGMTQEQAEAYRATLVKGETPFVTQAGVPITKQQYKQEYETYLRVRKAAREEPIITKEEVPSMAEIMREQAPPPTKITKYPPTVLGGLQLAWAKGREVVAKVKEKYVAYTPPGLIPVTKTAIDFSKQLSKILKFEEVKDVGVKVKEKAKIIPKGIAWVKEEFGPEIKTEVMKLKGIREWQKDMEKIERTFLKAREGYVWAEEKAKKLRLEPIVKQPVFLKDIDPYKEFREQTKKQVVGVAQVGKVTMGAMTGITEEIKVKPYKLPLIYAAGVVVGPAAAKVIGVGKVAKVAGVGFGVALAAGIGVEAMITPPGLEREKVIGVRAAELAAFLSGAKYGIERKPITKLYKEIVVKPYTKYIKEPRFERDISKWMKSLTAEKWTYLEKRAFIPIKKIPQRTLFGEPISKAKIKWLREDISKGYYRMDVARYELPKFLAGYEKFVQQPLKDIYTMKAIDLAYPKVITVTPEKMTTMWYRQMLGAEPGRFIFKKPKLKIILDITKIDKSIQAMLVKPTVKVTKIERPFYISKPKLPKLVILGKPKKITPVHLKPEPRPVKIKAAELLPTVGVRPVLVAEPKIPPADVGEVLGTIIGGRALAGALVVTGMKVSAEAFQRQFGVARQRAEQEQAARLAAKLDQEAKQAAKQVARQITKTKPMVKVIPKVTPVVKVIPILKIPTKQIPKLRQPVPTIPFFPYPTYPIPKEPKIPFKPLPPVIPLFKWPRGIFYPTARKLKKPKPFHKYMPSLIAVSKKITIKEMKMPKYLSGVGIRPIVKF